MLILRVDLFYGIAAAVILASGVLRVIWFGKGWNLYLVNGVFLPKMGAFLVLGLISIYPTVLLSRWKTNAVQGTIPPMDGDMLGRVRRVVIVEAAIFVTIPFLAVLMAGGIGSF